MAKKRGEGIVKVSDLFQKYRDTLTAPQKTVTKTFVDVVEDLFGAKITTEQCSYSVASRTLVLRISGPLKSEILMQKDEVLAHMRGRLGEKNCPQSIL